MSHTDDVHQLNTAALVAMLDFTHMNPWTPEDQPLTRPMIRASINRERFNPTPFPEHDIDRAAQWELRDHIARIATIATNWDEHYNHPIDIEITHDADTLIRDGHHRLAAAWFLRVPLIRANVFGFMDEWEDTVLPSLLAAGKHAIALDRRIEGYAAKVLAETVHAEPPRPLDLSDEGLARIISHPHIGRPCPVVEYPDIRDAILASGVLTPHPHRHH